MTNEEIVKRVADFVQKRGRTHTSGESLIFDRFTLEQTIRDAIKSDTTQQEGEEPPIRGIDLGSQGKRRITFEDE